MGRLALAACLALFLADEGGRVGVGRTPRAWPSWQVQAQGTSRSRRSGGGRQRQSLHNQNHESTVRNIVLPRFKSNPLVPGNHTSNVAIVVSSSRYWFNYRHVTNALSIYQLLKRGGMTDDSIILMLADDIPCNMRNPFRGKIFPRGTSGGDLMEGAEIDYSGTDVTVDAFLRVLLGRHLPGEEDGQRSWPKIDENTNVLVYLTGHGGDNFFKFQDGEELMSNDIASAFSQMYEMRRYREILFISDTCQAFTMADQIDVPNVFSVGSSLKDQNSYASHSDTDVGQSVIDRYSKIVKDFVDDAMTLTSDSQSRNHGRELDEATVAVMDRLNLHDILVRVPMNHGDLGPNSKVGHADHLCSRKMNKVPLSDFFAAPSEVRESQMNEGVEPMLWMNNLPVKIRASGKTTKDTDEECAVGDDESKNTEQIEEKTRIEPKGMSPTDPVFLAMAVGFILCINLSARIW